MNELLWMAAKAFLIALVLTPILRDVFRSYNLVDRPGRRKVHAYPIPRLGGLAIAAAYLIALLSFTHSHGLPEVYDWPAWKVLPGAAAIFLTGVLDDVFTLRPWVKLIGEIAAAGIAFSAGLRVEAIGNLTLPWWISLAITIFWLLLATNALNLIDGLDGLCTSMAFVGTGTFFLAAGIRGDFPLQHATLLLAGALLGFLCHNFSPATMFLGDSGALSIGFLLGCFGLVWARGAEALPAIAVPLLALAVPLMDVGLAVTRRFLSGRAIWSPDRAHVHHRLLDRGLSPPRVLMSLFLLALAAAGFAVLVCLPNLHRWQGFVILGFCASAWAGVRDLRYAEFEVTAKLIFKGEFRNAVRAKARLRNLFSMLTRCHSQDDWWETLVTAAREAGWSRIKWVSGQVARGDRSFDSRSPQWSFHIALSGTEALEIEGSSDTPGSAVDLNAFAQAVRGSFEVCSGTWSKQPLRS